MSSICLLCCSPLSVMGAPCYLAAQLASRKVGSLRRFSLAELSRATAGFAADHLVGEGGSSTVFKGTLADGQAVAVKVMKVRKRRRGPAPFGPLLSLALLTAR